MGGRRPDVSQAGLRETRRFNRPDLDAVLTRATADEGTTLGQQQDHRVMLVALGQRGADPLEPRERGPATRLERPHGGTGIGPMLPCGSLHLGS